MPEQANADTQDETLNESDLQSETDTTSEADETLADETTKSQPSNENKDLADRLKRMESALRKANGEAKTYRLEADDLKKYKEKHEISKLSEKEQEEATRKSLEQQLAVAQSQYEAVKREAQSKETNAEIRIQATRLGFADEDDAVIFLARHESDIERDDNGSPINIKELLTDLLKSKSYLKTPTQTRQSTSGGATNPPRSQTANVDNEKITWDYIKRIQSDPKAFEALPAARKHEITQFMNDRKNFRGR